MYTQWTRNLMMVRQCRTQLTLMIKTILEGSEQITKEELQTWSGDEIVIQRWQTNPMGDFMRMLVRALETESRSAENRRKEKERATKRPTLSESRSVQSEHELNIHLPPTSLITE